MDVRCPACGDGSPVPTSWRVRCDGCATRFDVVPPSERRDPAGPFRDGALCEARITLPPPDEDIDDLSGEDRTRFVRLFARRRPVGAAIRFGVPLLLGLIVGGLCALGEFAWAAAEQRSTSDLALGLWFATPFAAAALSLTVATRPQPPLEVWIERGRLCWSGGRSRPLAEIQGVCLEPFDVTRGGSTGKTVRTVWSLAFPTLSGSAERFLALPGLSEEGRRWLARHLDDGIALARSAQPAGR